MDLGNIDDQIGNPNINNRDHLVGRPTIVPLAMFYIMEAFLYATHITQIVTQPTLREAFCILFQISFTPMRAVLSSRMHYPPLPSRWWKKVECVGRSEEGLKPNPSLPHFNYTPFSARQANTKTERQNTITKTEHCKNCECCPVSSRLSE